MLDNALLAALGLFLFHALLFKLYRGAPASLAVWLAAAFVLIWANREIARGVAPAQRSRLQSAWAALDSVDLAFVAFFFVLLLVFDNFYLRATADGREYFAQARSLVIDHDLDFANERELFRTGNAPGIFPFGSAVLWLPFVVAGHLWLGVLNLLGGEHLRNGFSNPYQMAAGLGTLVYGFAGMLLAFRIARDYYPRRLAAAATMFVTAASFIVWYLAVESSYSHGNSLFTVTLFLFVWHRTRERRDGRGWAALGLAGGLMTMVRWQNGVFLLFPLVDGLGEVRRALRRDDDDSWRTVAADGGAFAVAFLLAMLPQLYFWKVVNGGWLTLPQAQSGQLWWDQPLVLDILFSSNHGLVVWHPVLFFAVLGIPLFLLRDFRFGALLIATFAMQIYVNAAVGMWWGGHAFGARRFASCALLFVLGLAALMRWASRRPLLTVSAALLVLVLGNASIMLDISQGRLPTSEGVTWEQMMSGAYRRVGNPFSFPAYWLFARRYGLGPWQLDQLGRRMYNNLVIDVGGANDARFLGSGWGSAEGEGEASFRWVTADDAIVVVPLKSSNVEAPGQPLEQADYVVRFRALPFLFPGAPPQSVELWANGRLAGRQLLVDEMRDYTIQVPRELLGRNLNVFRFRHAHLRSPAEVSGTTDTRELAARYEWIEFLRRPR
jgi:hypothetical protein